MLTSTTHGNSVVGIVSDIAHPGSLFTNETLRNYQSIVTTKKMLTSYLVSICPDLGRWKFIVA